METYQWRRSQGRVFPGREKATSPRPGRAWHGEGTDEVSPCWALVGEKEERSAVRETGEGSGHAGNHTHGRNSGLHSCVHYRICSSRRPVKQAFPKDAQSC